MGRPLLVVFPAGDNPCNTDRAQREHEQDTQTPAKDLQQFSHKDV